SSDVCSSDLTPGRKAEADHIKIPDYIFCQSPSLINPRAAEKGVPGKRWINEERFAPVILAYRERKLGIPARRECNPDRDAFSIALLPSLRCALVHRAGLEADAQRAITLHCDRCVVVQTNVARIG